MNLKAVSCAVVVACSLAVTPAAVTAAPVNSASPVTAAPASAGLSVPAATRKPVATVTATFTVLASGKVAVVIASNATKAQIRYRTAKYRKRTANKKIRRGTAALTLPVGANRIQVRAKATSKLARSPWATATPPAPPVAPPLAPPTTPPVVTPPAPVVDTTAPGPVTGLVAVPASASSLGLTWVNPGDADLAAVIVRRATGPTSPGSATEGAAVGLGSPTAIAVTDIGLAPGTTYTYAVFTRDTTGNTSAGVALTTATPGLAQTGAIERISTSATGEQAAGASFDAVWSPDGTRVAFTSDAANLVAGDTNGVGDVFVKTVGSGALSRVSTAVDGTQGNGSSTAPVWSPDSTRIVFTSEASNLVPGDTNTVADVFVKTLGTGAVSRVSTSAGGTQGDVASGESRSAFSPDGTQVAFTSRASNLGAGDTNTYSDVYLKTLATGGIVRVSTASDGTEGDGGSYEPAFSPDGAAIAFRSDSLNFVPDAVYDETFFLKDLTSGDVVALTVTAEGGRAYGGMHSPFFSPDGHYFGFSTYADNLVGMEYQWNVVVKDLRTGGYLLMSSAADGTPANYNCGVGAFSADSTRVAFDSYATNLVPTDTNGEASDVFVKTIEGGAISLVSTAADGTQGDGESFNPAFSPDGTMVVFESEAANLVPGDTNGMRDIFIKTIS